MRHITFNSVQKTVCYCLFYWILFRLIKFDFEFIILADSHVLTKKELLGKNEDDKAAESEGEDKHKHKKNHHQQHTTKIVKSNVFFNNEQIAMQAQDNKNHSSDHYY